MGHLSLVICHWSFVISCHASKLGESDADCTGGLGCGGTTLS